MAEHTINENKEDLTMFEAFLIISVMAIVWVLGLKLLGAVVKGFVNGVIGIFRHK